MKGNDFEMNRKIKQILSLLLAAVIFVGVMPMSTVPASAATNGHSQSEAMAWLNSKIGIQIGNGQCPALAREYYSYLGYSVRGDGKDYENNVPNGWTRTYYYSGYVPQPGDIAVWRATNTEAGKIYGHVAIVQSATSSSMTCYEQGASANYKVRTHGYSYGMVTCFIRPDFTNEFSSAPGASKVSLDKSILSVDEVATLTWTSCETATYYWISCWGESSQVINEQGFNNLKQISFKYPGKYSITVVAGNSKGETIGNWIEITVYDSVPKKSVVSLDKSILSVDEVATLTWTSCETATYYWISCWGESSHAINEQGFNNLKQISFKHPGKYSITVVAGNSKGETIGNWIEFIVIDQNLLISFDANGGYCSTTSKVVTYGKPYGDLPVPSRNGYKFDGWYTKQSSGEKITKGDTVNSTVEITLYAHWTANNYILSYNANGGTGSIENQTKIHGENLTLSSVKPIGKSFAVNYNANGGSVSASGKTVSQTFTNWNTAKNGSGKSYLPGATYSDNANLTLYAQYSNPSVGTLPTPTRSDYTFDGWYTAKDGGTKVSESLKVTANITLYAHWTKIEQHIPTVKSVKIDDNAEINYKSSYKISSEITAESGAEYTAEWQSSNPKVASVDKDGKVTALKKGTAKITCTVTDSYGNTVSDTCDVTVKYSFGQWLIKILLFGWIWY